MQPIQMQLSQNQKNFSQFFSVFPASTYNFEYFQKKVDTHRRFLTEIIDWKGFCYCDNVNISINNGL